ncbi:MAG TPA: tannase/feruloyl esterase family alpha/beta hydrolase [Steroidobacteraceae bacterium]|nr:tannase/feruloyl esterase family alpha/beta hydrolase [Steroidobacteraceae bacterium]
MRRVTEAITILAVLSVVAGAAGAGPTKSCDSLNSFTLPGLSLAITKTEQLPAGPPPVFPFTPPFEGTIPARCLVTGVIEKRTGHGGKPYGIEFSVALPDEWNGRFLFQGGGGFNGTLYPPLGFYASGHQLAIERGFAVVSTDGGHKGAVFDGAFFEDQEATLNFLYRANDKVTQVAKALVAAYYGRPPEHSYFVGCSTGGREAMMMSQRFPGYFDGIVAGAPAMRTSYSGIGDRLIFTQLNAIAPRDDKGKPVTARALSDGDRALVIKSLLKACDAKDGAADGMIFDVEHCGFDPTTLVCKGAKTDACLSAEQARAVKVGFAGPKDSRGVQVYPGFWYDTGIANTRGLPGLLVGPAPFFPDDRTSLDVDREAALAATPNAMAGDTASWTELNAFSSRGGKLLFVHGVSDNWFSAQDTTRYYQQLTADNGGAEAVMKWSRHFLVPGMGHCGGGDATLDQFDLLTSVVDWVEKGVAPDSVIATGPAIPGRSRPLCAYPKHAHYKGAGDLEKAENFECR